MSANVISKRVEIEKGIPVPSSDPKSGEGRRKYPWLTMEVGDSFLMPNVSFSMERSHANARSCINNIEKRYGLRFRKKYEKRGIRIWRIA